MADPDRWAEQVVGDLIESLRQPQCGVAAAQIWCGSEQKFRRLFFGTSQ
jgi:hypothetical protein